MHLDPLSFSFLTHHVKVLTIFTIYGRAFFENVPTKAHPKLTFLSFHDLMDLYAVYHGYFSILLPLLLSASGQFSTILQLHHRTNDLKQSLLMATQQSSFHLVLTYYFTHLNCVLFSGISNRYL